MDSYFGCCPFHDERTPSFHVRPDEKHYHCFGCSESGDPFDFVMQTEGLDFKGALESLADRFGVKLETEEESPEAAAARARRERLYALLARVDHLLRALPVGGRGGGRRARLPARPRAQRGDAARVPGRLRAGLLGPDRDRARGRPATATRSCSAAGLAQRKRSQPENLLDRFRGRIMFPTSDARGRVLGFGARIMVPSDREAEVPEHRRGRDLPQARGALRDQRSRGRAAAKAGRMVLAEGYTDVIALHQAGVAQRRRDHGHLADQASRSAELVRSVQRARALPRRRQRRPGGDGAGREALRRLPGSSCGSCRCRSAPTPAT